MSRKKLEEEYVKAIAEESWSTIIPPLRSKEEMLDIKFGVVALVLALVVGVAIGLSIRPKEGDVNGDGVVDIEDVSYVISRINE